MHTVKKRENKMLQVNVGDVIRGYDFKPMAGRGDSYVEGVVEAVRDTSQYFVAYRIIVTKDVFGGEQQVGEYSRVGQTVFVPWKVDFMEYQGRVMNLSC
jgi:hypothetical protein